MKLLKLEAEGMESGIKKLKQFGLSTYIAQKKLQKIKNQITKLS
ncbi:hypothetical protein N9208_04550 [Akkermansiaceae bacterium]|nr:hypothetical protein [Akkermansiaceae bacterium]MDB4524168.1 hypothetical protein [Akkermansiaceae bacterium]MDB4550031.1 hypothetical protein [Akkermansiaceae bacterium]MDC0286048.1 hypothetical protein [Akkermansiaceae bacterium]